MALMELQSPPVKSAPILRLITLLVMMFLSACVSLKHFESDVITSPLDTNQYRSLSLENGLQVMLVSDADADKAAAALDVHVGSGHDPEDRQGLAHYLEHMLFLGTEKYPEAGEYQAYINQHGGTNNAYTVINHTNYHFSIDPAFLQPALDRFAHFFIDPLFTEKYVERERAIVHSEFMARRTDEPRRLWTAQSLAYNPAHPQTHFSVGSEETLADREGDSVRDTLIEFYQRYYYAGNMALVLVGNQSLDVLEAMARDAFMPIRDQGVSTPAFDVPLLSAGSLPLRLDLAPIKEIRRVSYNFPIPSTRAHYRSRPLQAISNLLGHEGEGSLLAALKAKGWAESLSAGIGYMDELQGVMSVSVSLTPVGSKHLEEMGEMLFAEVALIREKGIDRVYFEEQKQLAALDFQYQEKSDAYHLAQSLASRLHRLPAKEVISGVYLLSEWQPELIHEMLAEVRPDNLLMVVVDPEVTSDTKTDWYDVAYQKSELDPGWLDRWQKASTSTVRSGLGVKLALPAPNPFVPERLDLVDAEGDASPTRLETDSGIETWHQTTTQFGQPKASFYFSVRSPVGSDTPRHAVQTELLVKTIEEQLSTNYYPAYLAGLSYQLYRHSRGFSVRINGYADKQDELLNQVVTALKQPQFTSETLQQYQQELARHWENSKENRPSDQSISTIYEILLENNWSDAELLDALEGIDVASMQTHATALMNDNSAVALSIGNVSEADTREKVAIVASALSNSNQLLARPTLRQIPTGKSINNRLVLSQPDAALAVYVQGRDSTVEELARTQLLAALMQSPFYQELRTENKVGYLVFASAFNIVDVPAMLFSVQSASHSVDDINALLDAFIDTYQQDLANMDGAGFEAARAGLISELSQKDKTLAQLAGYYWREIDRSAYQFDSRQQMIEVVSSLNKGDMLEYYHQLFGPAQRRQMRVFSTGDKSKAWPLAASNLAVDINNARAQLPNTF